MSKTQLKDEELLLLSRSGDVEAEQILLERFFNQRFVLGRRARPSIDQFINAFDYNGIFFKAYLNAFSTYRFGITTFRAYLLHILSREIGREIYNVCKAEVEGVEIVRLDTLIDANRSDVTFHEIVADSNSSNDPKAFLDFAEALEKLGKLPSSVDPRSLKLFRLRLDGYTLEEASAQIKIPYNTAKTIMKRFREFAGEVLHHGKSEEGFLKID